MNKRIVVCIWFFLLLCIGTISIKAQKSDKYKPRWIYTNPIASNSTFEFDVVQSDAQTLMDARNQALSNLLLRAGLAGGQTVKTNIETLNHEHEVSNDGTINDYAEELIKVQTTLEGNPVTLSARKLDEYWERGIDGNYHLITLYARSQVNEKPIFDKVELTTKYGIEDMWRSVIVPGWGQLYKGSTLKGGLIMGGTVACIGAIIYTDCTRASFNSKINKTHDAKLKLHYADQRTAYTTGRNICIGALCALYVYNIVDAIVAPGARRILTSPAGSNSFSYYWSPTLTDDMGVGVVAAITF